ncbi:MAG TPA: DNA polymerase I [Ignavibacteria bacterium]|nr:DNA polymerase I [Bacteroidota bacterium]HRI85973.1 DNA polymerase I [Ignavibacteria bacterium]HRK00952.1 DNA polymerase I [Ignavibacteria bacterium]
MTEKLFLIDAMAMIYRAYFAMISSPLINSKGKNTSAVYGFVNSLIKILEEQNPDHIAVCFDTASPTFRHKEFPAYKAQRQEIPSDMPWQIDKVKEIVKAFNIPMIELNGYEADDIIGTLVKQAEKGDVLSYMVTPDKDYMQLVSDKVFMFKPAKTQYGTDNEIIDKEGVLKKFGVTPDKVIEVLGLMGDASDNIPGIKGVGEKTAASLIQEFGSIENMYKNIDKITKPKLRENILSQKKEAMLSYMLVQIKTDVPLDINFHNLNKKPEDAELLSSLFEELEFKTLTRKFAKDGAGSDTSNAPKSGMKPAANAGLYESIKVDVQDKPKIIKTIADVKHEYIIIRNVKEFDVLIKLLNKQDIICFDTETDALDAMNTNLVGMSFCFEEFKAFYVPVSGNLFDRKAKKGVKEKSLFDNTDQTSSNGNSAKGIDISIAVEKVKPLLENKKIKFVGQNLKYDYLVMRNYGISMSNLFFDTLIGAYILRPEGAHDMDSLSEKFLGYRPISIKELIGKGKEQITMDKVDIDKAGEYAAEDADVTLQLFYKLKYELGKADMRKLCDDIEFPLIKVLSEMEFAGFKVDEKILASINKQTEKFIKEYEAKIYAAAGEEFNINSTQQLAHILFNKLNLTPLRKTKTGFSTDVKVLEELKYQHEIAALLVDYRMLTKLKSTYLDGLKNAINPRTGRVHTVFNQVAAATGRLSSVDPNLQNIPIRTEAGRSLRKAFVPRDNSYLIMSADYSQIELRIMAHYANDENMINAFKRHHDIHTETSMRIFGLKSKSEVTPGMRRKAKEVNFGIIYGIGAFGLANRLEIKNSEAKEIIERYFREYPNVRTYMEETKKFAHENGYVETLLGRRRYLSQINNQNAAARAEDERAAINMPIQGTAADMIKIAMNNIYSEFVKNKLESRMLLQVHDELVFEVKKTELEKVKKIVTDKMKNAIKIGVNIEVEVGVGESWYEAH